MQVLPCALLLTPARPATSRGRRRQFFEHVVLPKLSRVENVSAEGLFNLSVGWDGHAVDPYQQIFHIYKAGSFSCYLTRAAHFL
jgi:hypothetical protein